MSVIAGIFVIIGVIIFAFWVVTDPLSSAAFPKRPFKKKNKT